MINYQKILTLLESNPTGVSQSGTWKIWRDAEYYIEWFKRSDNLWLYILDETGIVEIDQIKTRITIDEIKQKIHEQQFQNKLNNLIK